MSYMQVYASPCYVKQSAVGTYFAATGETPLNTERKIMKHFISRNVSLLSVMAVVLFTLIGCEREGETAWDDYTKSPADGMRENSYEREKSPEVIYSEPVSPPDPSAYRQGERSPSSNESRINPQQAPGKDIGNPDQDTQDGVLE